MKQKSLHIDKLRAGMILSENIYTPDGKFLLIKKGIPLSQDLIDGLAQWNVPKVKITGKRQTVITGIPHLNQEVKKPGIPFSYPQYLEERLLLSYNGKTILKLDDPTIQETKREAVKTAHKILINVAQSKTIDYEEARETAREMLRAISINREAFINIASMRKVDEYTFEHSVDVATYTTIIAKEYGVGGEDLETICTGALLHDVGKMLIDIAILNKPGKLTDEEFEMIKTHTIRGYQLLRENKISEEMAVISLGHHERCDGTGYPDGLTIDEMPMSIQMTAIADVYDALISDRVYKKAMDLNNAMLIILAESGKKYNAQLVSLFQRVIGIYPIGTLVRLNNGYTARVLIQNDGIVRPVIQLLTDRNGKDLKDKKVINLMDNHDIYIVKSIKTVAA